MLQLTSFDFPFGFMCRHTVFWITRLAYTGWKRRQDGAETIEIKDAFSAQLTVETMRHVSIVLRWL